MKANGKIARVEIKKLIEVKGIDGIIGEDLNNINERTGVSYCDMQNAISYYTYRAV